MKIWFIIGILSGFGKEFVIIVVCQFDIQLIVVVCYIDDLVYLDVFDVMCIEKVSIDVINEL